MRNTYLAVFNAYWPSWVLRITGMLVVVFLLLSLIGTDAGILRPWPVAPVLAYSCFWVFGLAGLTKDQFTTPAARLLPHFAKHHLATAALILGIFWLVVAGVLAGVTAASLLGTASMSLAIFAFVAWGICIQPAMIMVLLVLIFPPLNTHSGQEGIAALLRGDIPLASAALLLLAVVSFIVLGRKLSSLTEEQPAFRRWFSWEPRVWGSGSRLTNDQQKAIARSWFVRRQGQRLESVLAGPVTGLWSECRRLRIAAGYPSPAFVVAIALGASWVGLMAVGWMLGHPHLWEQPLPINMVFIAGFALVGTARALGKSISQEAARPVNRRRLLRQASLVLLTDLLKAWTAAAAVMLLARAAFASGVVTDPQTWHTIAFAFSWIPLFLAVLALLLRIRSDTVYLIVGMTVLGIAVSFGIAAFGDRAPVGPVAGTIVLAAGAIACYGAYRIWLVADLD